MDEQPPEELRDILVKCTRIAPSHAVAMINTARELRRIRQQSAVFAGSQGFVTTRDLLRWAQRQPGTMDEVAADGFMLLGERLRDPEERELVQPLRRTAA